MIFLQTGCYPGLLKKLPQSGLFAASDPVALPFTGKSSYDERGWLILDPVFTGPGYRKKRKALLPCRFRLPSFLKLHFPRDPKGDITARLIDLNSEEGVILMCAYGISAKKEEIPATSFFTRHGLKWIEPIFVFGRTWAIVCEPGDSFYKASPMILQWIVLMAGTHNCNNGCPDIFTPECQGSGRRTGNTENHRELRKARKGQGVYNSTYDALALHDFDGRIVDMNATMMKMFGISWEEAGDMTLLELFRT